MIAVTAATLMSVATPVFADDPATGAQPKTNQQMMKECMKKQKAANNGMSDKDMRKSCRDQIKANVDQPDKSSQPVVPAH
jgi:hypothetical protein